MKKTALISAWCTLLTALPVVTFAQANNKSTNTPKARLTPTTKALFNSFVDCNMAEAWIGDTFRIFPGKYGEDPVWGNSRELKFASGRNADEALNTKASEFTEPVMPPNTPPGSPGLHGAVWFETVYQDVTDKSGKTLYAIYHNENYPATLPYNPATGEGYIDRLWPEGLRGPQSAAAVPRIGIMKSTNGGYNWTNRGLFIEDLQPRMVLKPHNTALTFAGGVGDPSAVRSGNYLYLFFGEYSYPGVYDSASYNETTEWQGQCISVARIALANLDNPRGKATRWDGKAFTIPYNQAGKPINSLQIPVAEGGGAASVQSKQFYWGPSVSWNTYLNCWVMLMGRVEKQKWEGGNIYISFNTNADLGKGNASQQWTKPTLLVSKPGHIIWYPSLQPFNTESDVKNKYTCMRLGQKARLFYKDQYNGHSEYLSEYEISFEK